MSGKTLFFIIVFLFVAAWVPCFEATLYWNILWNMRNLRQWDRNSGPLQQVKVEKPVVLALSRDLGMKNFKIAFWNWNWLLFLCYWILLLHLLDMKWWRMDKIGQVFLWNYNFISKSQSNFFRALNFTTEYIVEYNFSNNHCF